MTLRLEDILNTEILAKYSSFIIIVFLFVFKNLIVSNHFWIALILTCISFYLFIYFIKKNTEEFIRNIDSKLLTIDPDNKFKYLYLDPNLIDFLWRYKEYKDYSLKKYNSMLKNVDNLLKVKSWSITASENDIEDYNYKADFELGLDFLRKASNYYISFEISIPKEKVSYLKHSNGIEKFRILLKKNLDDIYLLEKNKRRIIDYYKDSVFPIENNYNQFSFF